MIQCEYKYAKNYVKKKQKQNHVYIASVYSRLIYQESDDFRHCFLFRATS